MSGVSPRPLTPGRAAIVLGAAAALAFGAAYALAAASVNCLVNASGGYANCLIHVAPTYEKVKANHSAGTPYSMSLYRASDGARWGPWHYSDLYTHVVPLSVSGTITMQVDNRGTANPASYYCEMG